MTPGVPILSCVCRFSFNSGPLDANSKAQLAVTVFFDMVENSECFDRDKMLRFCLTASKNYRPVSYHNWEHAFSVTHCMYWVIMGAPTMFTELEVTQRTPTVCTRRALVEPVNVIQVYLGHDNLYTLKWHRHLFVNATKHCFRAWLV